MQCPACGNVLQQVNVADVTVEVCKNGCGGIWFDNFEIKKFDELHESAGDELLAIETNPNINIDRTKRLKCPKCDDVVMARHFSSVKRQVQVDECPGCASFWLDAGELGKIRSLFRTEQEREEATEAYYSEIFGDKLAKMKAESQGKAQKARRIANAFRFICPSYYIPGKQDWGAF